MLPANTLLFHWKKEQKAVVENLLVLRQKLNEQAIHDLRVAIKKIRAYTKLYTLLQPGNGPGFGNEKNTLPHTGQLFDITGRQRDVEICLAILASLQQETGRRYLHLHFYLLYMLKTTKAWCNQDIHQYKIKELAAMTRFLKEDGSLQDAVSTDKRIQLAINEQLVSITPHFKQPHTLRKQLKTIYYWLLLLDEKERYAPGPLHTILDELGNWQDYEIARVQIKHFRKDYLPKPFDEYYELKKLEAFIENKKDRLLTAVRKNLRNWLEELEAN